MLKLKPRRAANYKCPRHPLMKYEDWGKLPSSCATCHDIYRVAQASVELDRRARAAERTIGYQRPKRVQDTPFDLAENVQDIKYRLAPIDVGMDLRDPSAPVIRIAKEDDPIRVSYATRAGARRVLDGPQAEVLRRLRAAGYRVEVVEGSHAG